MRSLSLFVERWPRGLVKKDIDFDDEDNGELRAPDERLGRLSEA